jgi:hypothetical protein
LLFEYHAVKLREHRNLMGGLLDRNTFERWGTYFQYESSFPNALPVAKGIGAREAIEKFRDDREKTTEVFLGHLTARGTRADAFPRQSISAHRA